MSSPAVPGGPYGGWSPADRSPGPAYKLDPSVFRDGPRQCSSHTFTGRPTDPSVFRTPGPDAYSPERSRDSKMANGPLYSFGDIDVNRSWRETLKSCGPGPMYKPSDNVFRDGDRSGPCFSFSSRQRQSRDYGPGPYHVGEITVTKPKAPRYSIGSARRRYPSVFTVQVEEETPEN